MAFSGDRINLRGRVGFIRKESGWVMETFFVSRTDVDSSRRAEGHSPEHFRKEATERAASARRAVSRAEQLVELGRYAEALTATDEALKALPGQPEAVRVGDRIRKTMAILGVSR